MSTSKGTIMSTINSIINGTTNGSINSTIHSTINGTMMRTINGSLTLEPMSKEEEIKSSLPPEETTNTFPFTPNQSLGELPFSVITDFAVYG